MPLTTSELKAYYDAYELESILSFSDFADPVRRIDSIWLSMTLERIREKREREKRASELKKSSTGGPRRGPRR